MTKGTKNYEYAVQWMYVTSVGGWITRKMSSVEEALSGAKLVGELDELEARAVHRPRRRWYQFPGEWKRIDA